MEHDFNYFLHLKILYMTNATIIYNVKIYSYNIKYTNKKIKLKYQLHTQATLK